MTDEQAETIRFLMDPATYGGVAPEHIETHGAHVFLAGCEALKIKRAVKYDYMDLSSLDLRRQMLRKELELNRPVTPGIYRDVLPITRENNELALNGSGPVVEWVLRMNRFPKENELVEVAARGDLDATMAEALGRSVATYHAAAPVRKTEGSKLIEAILDELDDAFERMRPDLGEERTTSFHDRSRAMMSRVAALLDARGAEGRVRRCHGDLHLRNIVLIDGRPVPFDMLEFDEVLGTCDVLYDLAFLLMDLRHLGHALAANLTLNTWLFEHAGREDSGLAALPLFLSVRAGIRAMVTIQTNNATRHRGPPGTNARAYLNEALAALAPSPARLIAVGGRSGTGKTALCRDLAPDLGAIPGAVHLRSDLERKRLAGVDLMEHLPADAYSLTSLHAVYEEMMRRASTLLGAGQSVLVDATWMSPDERAAIEALAHRICVPFAGLWLDAPDPVLFARVAKRRNDASDADVAVVTAQIGHDPGKISWARIDASGAALATLAQARAALAINIAP